jgi:integrase
MPRKKKRGGSRHLRSRLYTRRDKDGVLRYYADLRSLGGKQIALKASDDPQARATSDREVAEKLLADRINELIAQRNQTDRFDSGVDKRDVPRLKAFAASHLVAKAKAGKVAENWLERTEARLRLAVEFFGSDRALATIEVPDVQAWLDWLQERPGRRGNQVLSGGALRHYVNAMSNLYRRAQAERVVPPGYNPVAAMLEKPTAKREEAHWLEVHEAALLLESARTYQPTNPWTPQNGKPAERDPTIPFMYALIATFMLTGGRKAEVLGLEVADINFARNTVTFRPHDHRRLKTVTSHRTIPLQPQLKDILRAHIREMGIVGGLLFPSPLQDGAMIVELRKQLDGVAERAGWKAGEIRTKAFRHTYCAARLQTLDGGAPISPFTVAREMGHGGMALVNRVYGHLGTVRHRSEHVEYRPEIIRTIKDVEVRRVFNKRLRAVRA